jgi:hypothetical protein
VFLFSGIELDQVVYAFLVMGVTALTLGTVGIAFSTWLPRTLPATVAAYAAAFLLVAGSLAYGLLFPTDADPAATTLPAPPVVTYLGPIVPLVTIANNAPIVGGYGVRFPTVSALTPGNVVCKGTGTSQTCLPTASSGPIGVAGGSSFGPVPPTGTTLPTGPFKGWQYWQASVAMQLAICLVALLLSALRLPPVRRLRWFGRVRSAD